MEHESAQEQTLRLYTALRLLQPEWAGCLVLCLGLGSAARNLARAVVACGGCGLFLECNPDNVKQTTREGCCDFVVNTPTEALRTLKVQLRRRLPLAVALASSSSEDWEQHCAELVDRGVLPTYLTADGTLAASASTESVHRCGPMLARGTRLLAGEGLATVESEQHAVNFRQILAEFEKGGVTIRIDEALTFPERRAKDAALLRAPMTECSEQRTDGACRVMEGWLSAAPVLFPRDRHRAVWAF